MGWNQGCGSEVELGGGDRVESGCGDVCMCMWRLLFGFEWRHVKRHPPRSFTWSSSLSLLKVL